MLKEDNPPSFPTRTAQPRDKPGSVILYPTFTRCPGSHTPLFARSPASSTLPIHLSHRSYVKVTGEDTARRVGCSYRKTRAKEQRRFQDSWHHGVNKRVPTPLRLFRLSNYESAFHLNLSTKDIRAARYTDCYAKNQRCNSHLPCSSEVPPSVCPAHHTPELVKEIPSSPDMTVPTTERHIFCVEIGESVRESEAFVFPMK